MTVMTMTMTAGTGPGLVLGPQGLDGQATVSICAHNVLLGTNKKVIRDPRPPGWKGSDVRGTCPVTSSLKLPTTHPDTRCLVTPQKGRRSCTSLGCPHFPEGAKETSIRGQLGGRKRPGLQLQDEKDALPCMKPTQIPSLPLLSCLEPRPSDL